MVSGKDRRLSRRVTLVTLCDKRVLQMLFQIWNSALRASDAVVLGPPV